jgi:hypothetical protein
MLKGVMTNSQRHEQMGKSIHLPLLKKRDKFNDRWVSIVCYGPSLLDTWTHIKRPIITVSGAHDFLVDKGITPDWHIDCDPREHKARMLKKPQKATKYLLASVCHPTYFEALKRHQVKIWHLVNGDDLRTIAWVAENHPEGMESLIGGGSSVGMRAMNVSAALGYRKFHIFGMDNSFTESRHAGEHLGKEQEITMVQAGERIFQTTKQMVQAAIEMEKFLETQDAEVIFHGDGLMQETAKILKQRN